MRRVILETPFKGKDWTDTDENIRFARLCGHDSIACHNEAWFASHLLYTQEGVLNDRIPEERNLGIEGGFAWKEIADLTVVYINRGISRGMHFGVRKSIVLKQPVEYRVLPNYPKSIQAKILTLTGASGVGKSSIVRRFLEENAESKLVTSFTTRSPRDSDIPGEYEYNVPPSAFQDRDRFLWVVEAHGNIYGTPKDLVRDALLSDAPHLMILTPEAVSLLHASIAGLGDMGRVVSFYILSPGEKELKKRLRLRGEAVSVIRKRIHDCGQWDNDALTSEVPYLFLQNSELNVGVEHAAQQMSLFV